MKIFDLEEELVSRNYKGLEVEADELKIFSNSTYIIRINYFHNYFQIALLEGFDRWSNCECYEDYIPHSEQKLDEIFRAFEDMK